MSWGSEQFSPDEYLQLRHPDVQVRVADLPGRTQGCVDPVKRIIWLDAGLDSVARLCTLTYEIGQLELGPAPADPRLACVHRRAAEEWAALMLIPTAVFVAAWGECLSLPAMAERCGVDLSTFRARIRAASNEDQDVATAAIVESRLSGYA